MAKDELGNRLKEYEKIETDRKFMKQTPIYARIDGRSFSNFTRGMDRPYDVDMSQAMIEVTKYLVKETGANTGYTQSDEISLCWVPADYHSEVFFAGKIQKMVSTLSALATAKFVEIALSKWPSKCSSRLPTFDARVFQVPSHQELVNCFLWRVQDAIKNSIQMTAQHHFSHNELQGLNQQKQLEKLDNINVVWGEFPRFFKEGVFVKKELFTKEVPGTVVPVIRSRISTQYLEQPFSKLIGKVDFITRKSVGMSND